MADHNNNISPDVSRANTRDLPPVPKAPKKIKHVQTEEVKPTEKLNGRPVPIMYNVTARRRLCEEREEPNVSPYPIISHPKAPKKDKKCFSLHSLLYKSPLLKRKPMAKRLFAAESCSKDSPDINMGSFTLFPLSPKHI